ncbi:MAG: ribosome biogenesis GTPase YlqF, partial [Oscillospiraceae bacterium]
MDAPSIQWFPGHMAKTRKLITDRLKLVDVVLEITDARVPMSSRNPELHKWLGEKPRIILLNKCDNADPNITRQWLDYYKK